MNLFLTFFIESILSYGGEVDMWFTSNFVTCSQHYHPANGKSIVTVVIDKVDGQSIDMRIRRKSGYLQIQNELIYSQKNITPLIKNSILLDNTDKNGIFLICLEIISDRGPVHQTVQHHAIINMTSNNNEVEKFVNSIMDMSNND